MDQHRTFLSNGDNVTGSTEEHVIAYFDLR